MNAKLRTEAKNDFEKDFFKLMNNAVFGKTVQNVRKYRDIKLVAIDKRRNQLASEPNYHTPKYFSDNLEIEMKKTKVKMNKSIYLDMLIFNISKPLMYEFGHYYIKPEYQDRTKLCHMDTDSFVIHIITENDIANDIEKWFDMSNYEEDDKRPLSIGTNKKVICLFKDELDGKITKEFVRLRAKTYICMLNR